MAYNFRKEQKELYVPGKNPSLINLPMMKYLAVRGHGDPNQENSEYKKAIEKLYAVTYTIKMSKKAPTKFQIILILLFPHQKDYGGKMVSLELTTLTKKSSILLQ